MEDEPLHAHFKQKECVGVLSSAGGRGDPAPPAEDHTCASRVFIQSCALNKLRIIPLYLSLVPRPDCSKSRTTPSPTWNDFDWLIFFRERS